MQGSVRDFSIFNVKNIPQNQTTLVVCCKKQGILWTLSLQRAICNEEKDVNKCIGCIKFFGVHKNKLAYLQYTMHTIYQVLVPE